MFKEVGEVTYSSYSRVRLQSRKLLTDMSLFIIDNERYNLDTSFLSYMRTFIRTAELCGFNTATSELGNS
jgi:hypothetical protein